MARWLTVALCQGFLFFLLWTAAVAQGPSGDSASFVIETFPPGARIYDYGAKYLGLSGQPIKLSRGNHSLSLRLEGHQTKDLTLGAKDILLGRYPDSGTLDLRPLTWTQNVKNWLQYRWAIVLPLAMAGILTLGLSLRHGLAWRRQQRVLGGLVNHGTEGRSLIMQRIGAYRVISHLGQGGMGDVYQAVPHQTLDLESAVAIKVMSREMREEADSVQRFLREIVVSQGLAHPGIVEMKEWGWHGDRLFLVMELIEGEELRHALPQIIGDLERTIDVLSQLMEAVEYAHQRGVAHRDLKPENVMLTPSGRIKIMDFGLARAIDSQTLTQAGSTMGTPKYMAPEMVASSRGDDRVDQYALGIMAYEILTGRLPFESDEILYLLYCHANQEPPTPSSVRQSLNESVDKVLLKMMSKAPRDRYRDVESARVALLEAIRTLC